MAIWTSIHLVATIIVAGCFLVSGFAKVRDATATGDTFRALGVVGWLDRPIVHRIYPWVEIAVGLGMLVGPALVWWIASFAAFGMLGALTLLVSRVLARSESVACNCFGRVETITSRTRTRNAILFSLSVVVLVAPPLAAAPVIALALVAPDLVVAALSAAALGCVLTVLSFGAPRSNDREEEGVIGIGMPVPDVRLTSSSGVDVRVRTLIAHGAVLLVHVKVGCSSCDQVLRAIHDEMKIADVVTVRIVEQGVVRAGSAPASRLWDVSRSATPRLGLTRTPSALLIAADGTTPVRVAHGSDDILALIDGIEHARSGLDGMQHS